MFARESDRVCVALARAYVCCTLPVYYVSEMASGVWQWPMCVEPRAKSMCTRSSHHVRTLFSEKTDREE